MFAKISVAAKLGLAAVVCALGLAAADVARATTSTLVVDGAFDYLLSGDTVILRVDRVRNVTNPPRISGELTLELWAFRLLYQGTNQEDYQQNGYKLASYPIGRLAPGYFLFNVDSGPIPFQPPPPGTWYITSMIVEYDASAINFGGLLPRAYQNYEPPKSPLVVAAPVLADPPQAGLWIDPTQVGNAYSITVKDGQATVVVNAFQPDGAPIWYWSSGPLLGDGQVYIGTLDRFVGGPCIPCADPRFPTPIGNDGNITILFLSPTSATVFLPGGRIAHIVPVGGP